MSFWEDSSPAVKGVLVLGVLLFVYLLVARFAEIIPFSCPEESTCTGILCSGCEAEEGGQDRGFQPNAGVAPAAAED